MKIRKVHTKMWNDDWFASLSTKSKLLFMYLFTNQYIGISGMYEMSDRIILFDTGLTLKELEECKQELAPKVSFSKGFVFVRNAEKYDPIRGEQNTLLKTKLEEMKLIPDDVVSSFDAPSMPHRSPIDGRNGNGIGNGIGKKEIRVVKRKEETPNEGLNSLIQLFSPVNPSYKTLYPQKGQRLALERMINEHGREKVEGAIRCLPDVVGKPYAPTITSPFELEKKMGSLIAFLQKTQGEDYKFSVTKL